MVNKDEKLKELIQKHKPMTKKELVQTFRDQAEMKSKMTTDASVLEQNLINFNKIEDPLLDPETGNPLCWIRRPTAIEFDKMIPTELLEYKNKPEEVPDNIMKKYQDFQFDMMANLIENPKHDAQWWKEHSNLVFQSLFQKHLTGILEDLGINAENF
jgi:hypothetical protein